MGFPSGESIQQQGPPGERGNKDRQAREATADTRLTATETLRGRQTRTSGATAATLGAREKPGVGTSRRESPKQQVLPKKRASSSRDPQKQRGIAIDTPAPSRAAGRVPKSAVRKRGTR